MKIAYKKINKYILMALIISLIVLLCSNYKLGIAAITIIFVSMIIWKMQKRKSINKIIYLIIVIYPINNLFVIRFDFIDIRILEILFVFLFLEYLVHNAKNNTSYLEKLSVNKFLIIFLASVLVSTIFSTNLKISCKECIQYVYIFLLFLFIESSINTRKNFEDICEAVELQNIIFIAGLFISFPQIIINIVPHLGIDLFGKFSMPLFEIGSNYRASIYAMGAVESANYALILIYLNNACKKVFDHKKNLCNIMILFNILILILTFSRAAWIVFIIVYVMYRHYNKKNQFKTLLLIILGGIIIISVPEIYGRIQSIANVSESSNKDHIVLWTIAIKIGMENFIFGIGPGTFIKNVSNYGTVIKSMGAYTQSMDTHNLFLQAFSEQGIIGIVTLAILIIFIIFKQNGKIRKYLNMQERQAKINLFLAFLSTTLMSLTMNAFKIELYWIVLALLVSSDKYLLNQIENLDGMSH